MGKESKQMSPQRRYTNDREDHETMLIIYLAITEMQIETTMTYHFITTRMATRKKLVTRVSHETEKLIKKYPKIM